jgi:hypothetical protein
MFQCAALASYAKKHGATWGFPSDTREVPHLRKMFPSIPVLDGNFKRINLTDPQHFNYSPLQKFNQDTTLLGFFQSEKYFEGAEDEIMKMFKLNVEPNKFAVSIHVRRGDYVQHSNSFPPVNYNYLNQAIKFTGRRKFQFFSDDIEWCRNYVKHECLEDNGLFEFDFCEEKDEFKAMSLMASCPINIISNSTFSWWAAWLNPYPNKLIISPSYENWFGPGFTGSAPKDLIPDSWHQIKFR